jgi:hypothetical protein
LKEAANQLLNKKIKMTNYRNLGGNSGVAAYESAEDSITVQFNDGALYLYNNAKPGRAYVDKMKQLALNGSGLNSLISVKIKKNYYRKLN